MYAYLVNKSTYLHKNLGKMLKTQKKKNHGIPKQLGIAKRIGLQRLLEEIYMSNRAKLQRLV